MAVPNDGDRVASNWEKVVKTSPEDQIHDDYLLLEMLSKGEGFVSQNGGDFLTVPLEYALNATISSYSDLDPIDITRQDVFDRSELEWKEVGGSVVISDLERDRNKGDGQKFELLPAKMESARKSMRRSINTQLYSTGLGNGGKDITGFAAAISSTPTTGTYAGINRGTFSFFRNQQTSGAQTVSAFDNLRAAFRSIYNLASNGMSSDHPKNIITDRTTFQGYHSLLIANERFADKKEGDGAFKNEVLKFAGAFIGWDAACPSGTAYFWNPEFIKLYYMVGQWMKMLPGVRPANQTAEVRLLRTMCQLVNLQPRRSGVVTAIT